MAVRFQPSAAFSVGMEMEFQLIDPQSLDLADAVLPLLRHHPDATHVKPEIFQTSVEVASPPAVQLADLAASMRGLLRDLRTRARSLGVGICSAGTHPFYQRSAAITPGARYRAMEEAGGWLVHHQVTFATHVHLGVSSGDEAVTLMAELQPYVPLLIALSANSPFWQGEETRFAAFRPRVLATARSYGPAPDFADWAAFARFMSVLERAGVARDARSLHWDLRPSPRFGTVEVRVMDAQPTLSDALALVALLRALVRYLQRSRTATDRPPRLQPLPWWLHKDNCFVASRYGIDGRVVVAADGRLRRLRELAAITLRAVRPFAAADETAYLDRLEGAMIDRPPCQRQRHAFAATGSLPGVVRSLMDALRDDLA
jgi:glutamate---cysteine ligase / carboxylate-amine ligase